MRNFEAMICPKCRGALHSDGKTVRCQSGHSFDIAAEGYINILPPHRQGEVPGDNAEMVRARRLFLAKDYYKPLRDRLVEVIAGFEPKLVIDAGCGEGYYTSRISAEIDGDVIGIDISKFAVKAAAKSDKNTAYAAANIHALPFKDDSADVILSCFCPFDDREYCRVLKKGGKFVLVTPYKKHLFGMKKILYEKPYENEVDIGELFGMEHTSRDVISYSVHIDNSDDITELFAMTPYRWSTGKEGTLRLENTRELDTEIEFSVDVYTKL